MDGGLGNFTIDKIRVQFDGFFRRECLPLRVDAKGIKECRNPMVGVLETKGDPHKVILESVLVVGEPAEVNWIVRYPGKLCFQVTLGKRECGECFPIVASDTSQDVGLHSGTDGFGIGSNFHRIIGLNVEMVD